MSVEESKFSLRKFIDYIKFFAALTLLYIGYIVWQSYDFIPIPMDNFQMSPQFEPKEFHVTKRFESPEQIKHGDIVYYDYPHQKAKKRKECLFFGRVVGLPGDKVALKEGIIYRNGKKIQEGELDEKYIRKDNLPAVLVPRDYVYIVVCRRKHYSKSIYYRDSRLWGLIMLPMVNGKFENK